MTWILHLHVLVWNNFQCIKSIDTRVRHVYLLSSISEFWEGNMMLLFVSWAHQDTACLLTFPTVALFWMPSLKYVGTKNVVVSNLFKLTISIDFIQKQELGYLSRNSNWLWTGWPGFNLPQTCVQTNPGSRPPFSLLGTGGKSRLGCDADH